MKYLLLLLITISILSPSCQEPSNDSNSHKIKAYKKADGDYSNIIRIEDSILEGDQDTSSMAKMTFDETVYDFGTVNEGDLVKHTFRYKNTGKRPLLLKVAHSTCGCTVPKYNTDTPLQPGGIDSIVVIFDTKNKTEKQNKAITVIANSHPNKVKLYLRGFVKQKTK